MSICALGIMLLSAVVEPYAADSSNESLLRLHIIADALMTIAFLSIPIMLIGFVKKRKDIPFSFIFRMFSLFLVATGLTHLFAIATVWSADFLLYGWVKMIAAICSIATAVALLKLIPQALRLPNHRDLDRLNISLEKSLSEKNQLLALYQREHKVASEFQQASLPSELPQIDGFDIHCHYLAGKNDSQVGGDWYDAFRLEDGRLIVSIGDVTGSGLEAAVTMAGIRQVIRGTAFIHADPVLMLEAADKSLKTEKKEIIATAFIGVIDPVTRRMVYASAGHPPPSLIIDDGSLVDLQYDGIVLGLHFGDPPPACKIDLPIGSLLVMYTDGLIESKRNILDGERRLKEAISSLDFSVKQNFAKIISDRVLIDGCFDDVAILTIRIDEPHASDESSEWFFDSSDAEAASRLRHEISASLERRGGDVADIFAAGIIIGEIIGNVYRYAPGPLRVQMDWSSRNPVLHVIDYGLGFTFAPRLPVDPLAERGRGLYIVQKMALEFNVDKVIGGGSHARAVLRLGRTWQSRSSVDFIDILSLSEV